MEGFEIVFDSPSGYHPGQAVTGKVILDNSKDITARSLIVIVNGGAHTKWAETDHNHRECNGKHNMDDDKTILAARVNYVSGETMAWTASKKMNKIPSGKQIFPFSFLLPEDCPPNYDGPFGYIHYSVRAELDRPWKFNKKAKQYFKVVPSLNSLQCEKVPILEKSVKLVQNGVVTLKVSFPNRAFAPGEHLPVTLDIENSSQQYASCAHVELHEHATYLGNYDAGLFTDHSQVKSYEHQEIRTKKVLEAIKNIHLAPNIHEEWKILIPDLPPTYHCPIIDIKYCLTAKVETTLGNSLLCELPLVIGAVPVNNSKLVEVGVSSSASTLPSAPSQEISTSSSPPAYTSSGPSAPPPSYEDSMSVTKF